MYINVYKCICTYIQLYVCIQQYMYAYVCICMYNSEMGFKTSKYKKQYMQVYSCICMYMHVNICICMNMQLYVWICLRTHLTHPFFSVSGLVSKRCARRTWKLAGDGHDSCLVEEESCQSWAARGWAKERCQQADLRHTPSVCWSRLSSITVQQKPNSGGEALLGLETSSCTFSAQNLLSMVFYCHTCWENCLLFQVVTPAPFYEACMAAAMLWGMFPGIYASDQ